MSEEPTTADLQPAPDGWGQPITEESQVALDELAAQQRIWAEQPEQERGESHFTDVRLTGADVFWLAARAVAGPEGDLTSAAANLRDVHQRFTVSMSDLHLEGAILFGAHPEEASLFEAQLERAKLGEAQLEGTDLGEAYLSTWKEELGLQWRMARLFGALLEGAHLREAHLERAELRDAHLEGANLLAAQLKRADLGGAYLKGANLHLAQLTDANLFMAHLEGATLREAQLKGANLFRASLEEANLRVAHLGGADLFGAHLEGADLGEAHLEGVELREAHLEGADLFGAHLEGADLFGAHLEGAELREAHLEGADLREASFDRNSHLNGAHLNGVMLDQVVFDNTNLTVVRWSEVRRLGDETAARSEKSLTKKADLYHAAARSYRAMATALRTQGLSTEATRFHYRAELMARYESLYDFLARLFSRRFYMAPAGIIRWLVSWLLGTFAGYGDRLGRLFVTYLVTVTAFAGLMFAFAGRPPSVDSIRDVYVLSITSFHGRGLQPPGLPLSDALATLAAVEAFFGLAIEALFIAAFTRRVTGG